MEYDLPLDLLHLTKELNQSFTEGWHRNNFWVFPPQTYRVGGRKAMELSEEQSLRHCGVVFPFVLSLLQDITYREHVVEILPAKISSHLSLKITQASPILSGEGQEFLQDDSSCLRRWP